MLIHRMHSSLFRSPGKRPFASAQSFPSTVSYVYASSWTRPRPSCRSARRRRWAPRMSLCAISSCKVRDLYRSFDEAKIHMAFLNECRSVGSRGYASHPYRHLTFFLGNDPRIQLQLTYELLVRYPAHCLLFVVSSSISHSSSPATIRSAASIHVPSIVVAGPVQTSP